MPRKVKKGGFVRIPLIKVNVNVPAQRILCFKDPEVDFQRYAAYLASLKQPWKPRAASEVP